MPGTNLAYHQELGSFRESAEQAQALLARHAEGCAAILKEAGTQAILRSAQPGKDLQAIEEWASRWRKHARHLVVVGAGGSGLSGHALAMLKTGMHATCQAHALHVLDNLDAHALPALIASLPLEDTAFLFVSKSGTTVETYAQSRCLLAAMPDAARTTLKDRAAVITVPGANPLREVAAAHGIPAIDHDPDLGGRFSILSAVGLIPAAFMGIDIAKLRGGAARSFTANMREGSGAMLAAAHLVAHMNAGRNIAVHMPYSEQLYGIALWWRQSWAESLGKNGKGSTPIANIGTADQHSQLQLYLGGPDDKSFTLLLTGCHGKGPKLPEITGPLAYLSGKSVGDLVAAQQEGTLQTLIRHKRPVRTFLIPDITEEAAGALIAHFTLEILFAGAMLGVNPFDQPAVEESKRLSHAYLTDGVP